MVEPTPNRLKHLDYIQTAISRMAQNSFVFKGWAITLASGLTAFGAVQDKLALLVISLGATLMFWGLDGYYLWLERGFIRLYDLVAQKAEDDIDFGMSIDKSQAFRSWFTTCFRPHLLLFYVLLAGSITVGMFLFEEVPG